MAERREQFGRVSYRLIDSGALATAKLTRAEAVTFIALSAHVGQDYQARPALTRLAALTGADRRTVQRAIAGLRDKGLLTVERGGGRGNSNVYRLAGNPGAGDGVSSGKGGVGAAVSTQKGRHRRAKRAAQARIKGGKAMPPEQSEQSEHARGDGVYDAAAVANGVTLARMLEQESDC